MTGSGDNPGGASRACAVSHTRKVSAAHFHCSLQGKEAHARLRRISYRRCEIGRLASLADISRSLLSVMLPSPARLTLIGRPVAAAAMFVARFSSVWAIVARPTRPSCLILRYLDVCIRSQPYSTTSSSSNRWLARQRGDVFSRRAKVDMYKSRAAYKLLELDSKYRIFKRGQTVVDLVASTILHPSHETNR